MARNKPIVEMTFDYKGYKCVVNFNDLGHRCGYVGVPKGHFLYGKDHQDHIEVPKDDMEGVDIGKRGIIPIIGSAFDDDERMKIESYFDVHGGITYAGGGEYTIKSNLWWFGFDCGHYGDDKDWKCMYEYFPDMKESFDRLKQIEDMFPTDGVIRTKEYVEQECKNLVDQIIELEEKYYGK